MNHKQMSNQHLENQNELNMNLTNEQRALNFLAEMDLISRQSCMTKDDFERFSSEVLKMHANGQLPYEIVCEPINLEDKNIIWLTDGTMK